MKLNSRFLRIFIPMSITLFLIAATSLLFVLHMNRMIENHTQNTITELAEHDMSAITQFVEVNWAELGNIGQRLRLYQCETISDAQEKMNMERATSEFYNLFLIDEDNVVYSDRKSIYYNDELHMIEKFNWKGRKSIVRRLDYSFAPDKRREMLFYAIKLDDFYVEGKKIVALVGATRITEIQDKLTIYSFHDVNDKTDSKFRGYSSVINYYGDYIVNINQTETTNQNLNFFTLVEAGRVSGNITSQDVAEKMFLHETFRFSYKDADGVHKLLYFMPIDKTDWYFISVVDRKVFSEQTGAFVVVSGAMILIAFGITISMCLLVLYANREAMLARAEGKARSEFLSNMSHEIRTPLNGIIGLLYLMRSHLHDEDKGEFETMLDKADDSAEYLLSLVSDILDISKLRAEKLKLTLETFRLDKMLTSVADMQRSNAEKNGIFLKLESKINSPNVVGDETRLKQVLMNIVGNSVKFTPHGGMITIKATQGKVVDGFVDVKIVCSDTGVGMSEEFQKTIWDSFTQENNRLSNGVRGTGLGMAITKGIVDAMGGTITVESKLNKGSKFTINFTLPVDETKPKKSEEQTEKKSPRTGEGIKLILAEDNELNAEILAEILKSKGFEIAYAENGKIARDIFVKSKPDEYQAILMDMQMPVMDGCEATRQIRASNHPNAKTVQIFACTANVFQEDKDKATESGMNDFLIKPINVKTLFDKLAVPAKSAE